MFPKGEHALRLAAAGFRVFPLLVGDKRPAIDAWPARATIDEARIRKWWAKADYNIGVAGGQGLVILDYDMKPGQRGAESLARHTALDCLPRTLTVRTPNGLHFYFRSTVPIRNTVSDLAPHVDIRGEGGYVVGPGSVVNGTEYTIVDRV